jgi:hypothetical protein
MFSFTSWPISNTETSPLVDQSRRSCTGSSPGGCFHRMRADWELSRDAFVLPARKQPQGTGGPSSGSAPLLCSGPFRPWLEPENRFIEKDHHDRLIQRLLSVVAFCPFP